MVGISERLCSEPLPGIRHGELRFDPMRGHGIAMTDRPGRPDRERTPRFLRLVSRWIAAANKDLRAKAAIFR